MAKRSTTVMNDARFVEYLDRNEYNYSTDPDGMITIHKTGDKEVDFGADIVDIKNLKKSEIPINAVMAKFVGMPNLEEAPRLGMPNAKRAHLNKLNNIESLTFNNFATVAVNRLGGLYAPNLNVSESVNYNMPDKSQKLVEKIRNNKLPKSVDYSKKLEVQKPKAKKRIKDPSKTNKALAGLMAVASLYHTMLYAIGETNDARTESGLEPISPRSSVNEAATTVFDTTNEAVVAAVDVVDTASKFIDNGIDVVEAVSPFLNPTSVLVASAVVFGLTTARLAALQIKSFRASVQDITNPVRNDQSSVQPKIGASTSASAIP